MFLAFKQTWSLFPFDDSLLSGDLLDKYLDVVLCRKAIQEPNLMYSSAVELELLDPGGIDVCG